MVSLLSRQTGPPQPVYIKAPPFPPPIQAHRDLAMGLHFLLGTRRTYYSCRLLYNQRKGVHQDLASEFLTSARYLSEYHNLNRLTAEKCIIFKFGLLTSFGGISKIRPDGERRET